LESRSLKLNPEIIHVNDHLRDVVRLFEPRPAARGLYLKLDLPDRSPLAVLDRAAFDRIMNNLLSTALKFTLEGGVTISAKIDDESVIVEVTDTGVGISESFLPFVFDEFKQESDGLGREFEGNGLGMNITKRLVEVMNGQISVRSKKGVGTTFTVSFPRSSRLVKEAQHEHEQTAAATTTVRPRVLALDDEPNVLILLQRLLGSAYDLHVVGSYEEAIKM